LWVSYLSSFWKVLSPGIFTPRFSEPFCKRKDYFTGILEIDYLFLSVLGRLAASSKKVERKVERG